MNTNFFSNLKDGPIYFKIIICDLKLFTCSQCCRRSSPGKDATIFSLSLAVDTWYCDDVCAATNAELLFPEPTKEMEGNGRYISRYEDKPICPIHATRDIKRFASECGWMEYKQRSERVISKSPAERLRRCVCSAARMKRFSRSTRETLLDIFALLRFISALGTKINQRAY